MIPRTYLANWAKSPLARIAKSAPASDARQSVGSVASLEVDDLDFVLPPELEAGEPAEARGLARDGVRLMVSHAGDDRIGHTRFSHLDDSLVPGDLLVVNTSGTLNAAIAAQRADGRPLELRLSTRLSANEWAIELRTPADEGTDPLFTAATGEAIALPAGAFATLRRPYKEYRPGLVRLWVAHLSLPIRPDVYLEKYGAPIRYAYVKQRWASAYYQTAFASEMGSAEMPSAGRAFTPALIGRLRARGIQFAPLVLHTGVASLEPQEPPYPEYYRVAPDTAERVNAARAANQRVIAVGTTVVRALETVSDTAGQLQAGEGWTDLVVTARRGLRAVDGLLTGLHEPRASHLAMLAALAGYGHLRAAYNAALRERYLWHEFGDLHLILRA